VVKVTSALEKLLSHHSPEEGDRKLLQNVGSFYHSAKVKFDIRSTLKAELLSFHYNLYV
jgi:hypothetical protein